MSKRGKVLFIIHDLYQEDNSFPFGPAYMTSILQQKGYVVDVCCQDVYHYKNHELVEQFLKPNFYDLIGIGFLAARFKETVLELCHTVNEYKREAWLVLGGHGASPIPEYILETTHADIVAIGEAEETIVDLLECKLGGGKDLFKVRGIAFREDGNISVNPRRTPVRNLDSIPLPAWDAFPMDKYTTCFKFECMGDNDRAIGIATGRGCVNRCSFCYRMEKGIRFRSIERVVEEMKILHESYGVSYFIIQDELFVASKNRIFEFRDCIKKNGLKVQYDCNARVDIFDEELVECLKDSGCVFVNFGMESSGQNVLDLMGKRTTVKQNIEAAEIARKVGVTVGLNFIWGNVGDTEESLKGNVKLIKQYNTYFQLRTIRPVTPYPGCPLYYEAIDRGLLSGPADFFEKFKNSDLSIVNFTNIPDKIFYEILFEANKGLILDHYQNTSQDMDEANAIIQQFYRLYFESDYKFRGARHYKKEG